MTGKEYLERMKKFNDLPLNQAALKFLEGTHKNPVEDEMPHGFQLVMQLKRNKELYPNPDLLEFLISLARREDPMQMIEPMGLNLNPPPKTARKIALHVLESAENLMMEENLL